MFYFVFSPRPEDYEEVEEAVLGYSTRQHKVIVVKEYGKKGNHPHLNVVTQETVKDEKNMYRKLYKLFTTELLARNQRLLSIRKIVDFKKLVEGYLKKESKAEVLFKKGFNYRSSKESDLKKHIKELKSDCKRLAMELMRLKVEQIYD